MYQRKEDITDISTASPETSSTSLIAAGVDVVCSHVSIEILLTNISFNSFE